jgi:hypothetical protein
VTDDDQRELKEVFEKIEAEADANAVELNTWEMRFGFAHDCHCEEDVENDNTRLAPECYIGAADQAFEKLAETRGVIFGILASPSTDGEAIKRVLSEAFYGGALGL